MTPPFKLQLDTAGTDVQVASLTGAVALSEARELERGLLAGVREGRTRVVIDLRDVTEIGPGLLGVLLRIRRGLTRVDGRLALIVVGAPVDELVRTTVLAALIDVASDRDEAMILVSQRPTAPL